MLWRATSSSSQSTKPKGSRSTNTTRFLRHRLIPSTRTEATPGTYHSVVFAKHLTALLERKNVTKETYNAVKDNDKKPLQSGAMKLVKEAYLACLFILMTDEERYGGVKTALRVIPWQHGITWD